MPWVWANRRRPEVLFCLLWLIPPWLVFELVPTKLLHYTLPTFPALALLVAAAARERFGYHDLWRRRLILGAVGAGGLMTLVLALGVLAVPWLADGRFAGEAAVPLAAGLVAGVVAGRLLWRRRPALALVAALGGQILWSATLFSRVLPGVDGLWLSRQVAVAVAALRPCPATTLVAAGYSEPSLVFLTGGTTRIGGGDHAAAHLQHNPTCALALVERDDEAVFRAWLNGFSVKTLATFSGFNYSRGKYQTLTLYAAES